MRNRDLLTLGLVMIVLTLPSCGGKKEEEKAAESQAAKAKATVAAVTEGAAPAPTATTAPTSTPVPTSTPLPTAAPEDLDSAAEDLELIGVVRGASPSAVIAFEGRQEIFRKGDAVFDHGTVKEVREDSVIIRSGGEDVTLKIKEAAAPVPAEAPAEEVVDAPAAVKQAAPAAPQGPVSRAEARAAFKDLAGVFEAAEGKRVTVGGGRGIQFDNVTPGSFLAQLGLRSGDVLQKLNGVAITDLEDVPDLSAAAEGRELTVGFTRDGIGLTVSRPLQ